MRSHLYVESTKAELMVTDIRTEGWLPEAGRLGKREDNDQTFSFKMTKFWKLMYSMVTVINDTVLYS